MLKDEVKEARMTTKIGCFFVMKKGRIFARIKKGSGRGEGDTNLQLNQPKELKNELTNELKNELTNELKNELTNELNNAELAYNKAKEYETELINKYKDEYLETELNNSLSDINNYNGYRQLMMNDNMDYLTA